jgi:hypothetical protein
MLVRLGSVNSPAHTANPTTTTPSGTTAPTTGATVANGFGTPVHFVVRDGVVTIVGSVPTLAEKQQIQAAVAGVPGVSQVVDNLQVRPRDMAVTVTDQALLAQVRQAVQPVIASSGIPLPAFVAREGVVTILGTVASVDQSQQIETTVTQIPGVIRVSNRLAVPSGSSSASTNLTGSAPLIPNRFNLPQTNQVGATTNILLPTSRFNAPSSLLSTNPAALTNSP